MKHDDSPGREVIDLLARLVALPTESRSPNVDLIDLCAERCRDAGADVSVLPGGPGQANLLARFGPSCAGGLLLSGHTDVVPAGAGWATDPYRVTEVADRLYGRGTADMKGFVAAAMVAAERAAGRLDKPLYLALSYDEEIGCVGVRGLLQHLDGRADVAPDLVVVGEPTSMRVCVAHTGKASYAARFHGRAGHSSEARTHPSAVVAAAELAVAIDAVQRGQPAGETSRDRAGYAHVSTNVGTIGGGVAINVMAADADLAFEVRHSAEFEVPALLAPVWAEVDRLNSRLAAVGGGVKVEQLAQYPAMDTAATAPAVRRLHRLAETGPIGTIAFGAEGGLYAERFAAPVVICGPGDITDAHCPDEFVTLSQLATCRRVIDGAVAEFCDNEKRAS